MASAASMTEAEGRCAVSGESETEFTFCLKLSHFVHSDEMPNLVQTNGRKDSSPKREAE